MPSHLQHFHKSRAAGIPGKGELLFSPGAMQVGSTFGYLCGHPALRRNFWDSKFPSWMETPLCPAWKGRGSSPNPPPLSHGSTRSPVPIPCIHTGLDTVFQVFLRCSTPILWGAPLERGGFLLLLFLLPQRSGPGSLYFRNCPNKSFPQPISPPNRRA